jgi:hypothetical protein
MAFLTRLTIAFAGGLVVLAVLLLTMAYLLSDEPAFRRSVPQRYSVTVQDLDGPRVFRGTAAIDRLAIAAPADSA